MEAYLSFRISNKGENEMYNFNRNQNSNPSDYRSNLPEQRSNSSDHHCNSHDHCHEHQEHVHEIQGSVQIAERQEDPHNHRFATVSGEQIGEGINHFHEVKFRTDFYENHFHEYCGRTTGAVIVGDRHVHFLESVTTENDGHRHEFRVATLINDPIGEEEC